MRDLDTDLIVGADGARSATRRSIDNLAEPTYTGQIICYGHHPRPAPHLPANVLHFWRHCQGVAGYVEDLRDGAFWFSRHHSDTPTAVIDQETAITALRDTPVRAVLDTSWVSRPIALYAKHLRERAWHVPEALESFTASRRPITNAAYRPTPGRRPVSVTAYELDLYRGYGDRGRR